MGLPAEQFDYNYVFEHDKSPYLPQGPMLELIQGDGLSRMFKEAEKVAPKFWGVQKSGYAVDDSVTPSTRLIQLRKVLRNAPHQSQDINNWAFNRNAHDMLKFGSLALSSTVTLRREKKGGKLNRPAVRQSYKEILSDPEITKIVMDRMLDEHNPSAETVGLLEEWRLSREEDEAPNHLNLIEGIEAFQIFLFAVEGQRLKKLVADVAIKNYQ